MVKILLIGLLVALSSIGFYFFYLKPAEEKQLLLCIDDSLKQLKINTIHVDEKSLDTIPLFKGSAQKKSKIRFINLIQQQCHISEFKDSIKVKTSKTTIYPFLNFTVDHFNHLVSITGLVKTPVERENILTNFNRVYQLKSANEDSNWTIAHDINIDRQVKATDFDVFIALLLPSIDKIKLTDITLNNTKLTVSGLVRNKAVENEIISQLLLLFDEDLQIINQLELVTGNKHQIEKLQIELPPMPKLEEYNSLKK